LNLVLDASMTLAWQFKRVDPVEILIAERALAELPSFQAIVPALWYSEVANTLLRGERQGAISPAQTAYFLGELAEMEIVTDEISPRARQSVVLDLARRSGLTAYDATYLELVLRISGILATFDRQLASAARIAGARVFGDES